MLTGSGSEKMDRWGLKRLSTFGILARLPPARGGPAPRRPDRRRAGRVRGVDRFRPVVNLTAEAGWDFLKSPRATGRSTGPARRPRAKVRFGGLERIAPTGPTPAAEPAATPTAAGPPGRGRRARAVGPRRATRSTSSSRRCGRPGPARRTSRPTRSSRTRRWRPWSATGPGRPTSWPRSRGSARSPRTLRRGPARRDRRAGPPAARPGRPARAATPTPSPRPSSRPGRRPPSSPPSLRPDRGMDLAAARSRVHARRGGGDPGARTRRRSSATPR